MPAQTVPDPRGQVWIPAGLKPRGLVGLTQQKRVPPKRRRASAGTLTLPGKRTPCLQLGVPRTNRIPRTPHAVFQKKTT